MNRRLLFLIIMLILPWTTRASNQDITGQFKCNHFKRLFWEKGIIADTLHIQLAEVEHIQSLTLKLERSNITSLSGLEYFRDLEQLEITVPMGMGEIQIDTLDVSRNLKLKTIKIDAYQETDLKNIIFPQSGCPLETLICTKGKIVHLNLERCPQLRYLDCSYNRIDTLDLSQNLRLETVKADHQRSQHLLSEEGRSGALKSLTLPDNRQSDNGLIYLSCGDNQLQELDLSRSVHLKYLNCQWNCLQEINTSACPYLEIIHCDFCFLKALDFSQNTHLKEIYCGQQGYRWIREEGKDYKWLKSLTLPDRLNSNLTALSYPETDLKKAPKLKKLNGLQYLNCSENNLKNLNVRHNPQLKYLICGRNNMKQLNLKKNNELLYLSIRGRALRQVDLRNNFKVKIIEHDISFANNLIQLFLPQNFEIKNLKITEHSYTPSIEAINYSIQQQIGDEAYKIPDNVNIIFR